jgi:hypothetical protein
MQLCLQGKRSSTAGDSTACTLLGPLPRNLRISTSGGSLLPKRQSDGTFASPARSSPSREQSPNRKRSVYDSPRFLEPVLLTSMRFPQEEPLPESSPPLVRSGLSCARTAYALTYHGPDVVVYMSRQYVLQVPAKNPYRSMFCISLLALILGVSFVAGGLAIAAKNRNRYSHGDLAESTGDVVCVDTAGCEDQVSAVKREAQGTDGTLEGIEFESDSNKTENKGNAIEGAAGDEPGEARVLEHSIDFFLAGGDLAKQAESIRKQGFGVVETALPQPLLQQPHSVDVSTNNFKYDYVEAWFKSLLMYEVQRGGKQVQMLPTLLICNLAPMTIAL